MDATPSQLIERFYHQVWNTGDEDVARLILHKDFVFRGSLGSERNGPEGFIDYLRAVRGSLPDFVCNIQEIVTEGRRAVAPVLEMVAIRVARLEGRRVTRL